MRAEKNPTKALEFDCLICKLACLSHQTALLKAAFVIVWAVPPTLFRLCLSVSLTYG